MRLAGELLDRRRTSSPAATSSSTCCTTSSWSAAPGRTRSASTRWSRTRPPAQWSGFLLVRGGVHIVAYAKALEKLSGVDVGKLLPDPRHQQQAVPRGRASTRRRGCTGSCTASSPDDYRRRRRDLERPAPGGRQRAARSRTGRPEGVDAAGPRRRAAAHGAGRAGHRSGDVRGGGGEAIPGDEPETSSGVEEQVAVGRPHAATGTADRGAFSAPVGYARVLHAQDFLNSAPS